LSESELQRLIAYAKTRVPPVRALVVPSVKVNVPKLVTAGPKIRLPEPSQRKDSGNALPTETPPSPKEPKVTPAPSGSDRELPVSQVAVASNRNGFTVQVSAREQDAAYSLALELSRAATIEQRLQLLARHPDVDFVLERENAFFVRLSGRTDLLRLAGEGPSGDKVQPTWSAAVTDNTAGSQTLHVALLPAGALRAELPQEGYLAVAISPNSDQRLVIQVHQRGPPQWARHVEIRMGKQLLTGAFDGNNLVFSVRNLPEALSNNPEILSQWLSRSHLREVAGRLGEGGMAPIRLTWEMPVAGREPRLIQLRRAGNVVGAAAEIANHPAECHLAVHNYFGEHFPRVARHLERNEPVAALQILRDLQQILGNTPPLQILEGIVQVRCGHRTVRQLAAELPQFRPPGSRDLSAERNLLFREINHQLSRRDLSAGDRALWGQLARYIDLNTRDLQVAGQPVAATLTQQGSRHQVGVHIFGEVPLKRVNPQEVHLADRPIILTDSPQLSNRDVNPATHRQTLLGLLSSPDVEIYGVPLPLAVMVQAETFNQWRSETFNQWRDATLNLGQSAPERQFYAVHYRPVQLTAYSPGSSTESPGDDDEDDEDGTLPDEGRPKQKRKKMPRRMYLVKQKRAQ
jgi:hypothetical protein